jgi:hypothetical protein
MCAIWVAFKIAVIAGLWTCGLVGMCLSGVLVPASTTVPTASSPTGSNVLDPQARLLYLTTRGGLNSQQYDILTTQRIKLNLVLSVSVEEFFGDTLVSNIATLLG